MASSNPVLNYPPKKRRTAIYCRVSSGGQEKGLESQVRALRLYCDQNKIENYELFADENQSGAKASRPALDRMMKAVEAGEIESCIVFAFSLFARSVSHMLRGLEIMKKNGTNLISVTERLDLNTSFGNALMVILAAVAQLERDLISERVRCGIANAKAKGKKMGRARTRNSALLRSLLDAGLSFREIARISKSSHGSVNSEKREYMREKAEQAKLKQEALESQERELQAQPALENLTPSLQPVSSFVNFGGIHSRYS